MIRIQAPLARPIGERRVLLWVARFVTGMGFSFVPPPLRRLIANHPRKFQALRLGMRVGRASALAAGVYGAGYGEPCRP